MNPAVARIEAAQTYPELVDALLDVLRQVAIEAGSDHGHVGEWCAKCVEHGVAEEIRRNAPSEEPGQ